MRDDTPFRTGVRAAVQVAFDDLAALVKRRRQASANPDITATISSIAHRIATIPYPDADSAPVLERRPLVLDDLAITDQHLVAAAQALRDAEIEIIENEIAALPAEAQRAARDLYSDSMPPAWSEMSPQQQRSYIYRAQRTIAAAATPR